MTRYMKLTMCLLAATALSLPAENLSYTGTLSAPEDVLEVSFTLSSTSAVTIQTWAFGGGVNVKGQTIDAGGFDPLIALFSGTGPSATMVTDLSGNPLADADNLINPPWAFVGNCPPAGLVAIGSNNDCGDDAMQITLAAGTYTLLLSDANYIPAAINDDGSLSEGFTDLTAGVFQTCDPAANACITPNGNYAVDISSPGLIGPAVMLTPTPGNTLTGSSAVFTWSPGVNVTEYWLYVGTTGAGSANIYNASATASTTTASVANIPLLAQTIYVRLLSKIAGVWQYNDYTYTEASSPVPAAMSTPAPGSTLTGSSVTFTWTKGLEVTEYWLYIGTTGAGSTNVYNSAVAIPTTSATVTTLPVIGQPVYVRLLSKLNGAWQYNDYVYTEAGTPAPAAMSTPTPGTVLPGASATFTWTTGLAVSEYWLYVGTTGVGSTNIYNKAATTTSASVTGLPVLGQTVYVRLLSKILGAWQYEDYTYTASGSPAPPAPAAMLTPTPGSTLTGASQTFTWTAGTDVTEYWLYVGTTGVGSTNIYNKAATTTSASVTGMPVNGATVYVQLLSKISGSWQSNNYTYTAQ